MTTFKAALRSALTEAVGIPSGAPQARTSHHKAPSGSIVRQDGGYILELLGEVPTACPHCHKAIAPPRTRRRRLVNVVTPSGKILSTEIE